MEQVSRMKMSGDDSSCSLRGQVPWCNRFLLPSHGASLPEPLKGCPMGLMHWIAWRLHGQGDSLCSCATSLSSSSCRGSAGSWHPKLCLAQAKLSTVRLRRTVLGLPTFSCAAWRSRRLFYPLLFLCRTSSLWGTLVKDEIAESPLLGRGLPLLWVQGY